MNVMLLDDCFLCWLLVVGFGFLVGCDKKNGANARHKAKRKNEEKKE